MDRLIAKAVVTETVYKLAYGLDSLDRVSIASSFRPDAPFTIDLSDLLGIPAKEATADDYYKIAMNVLGGFDATQHLLGCPIVTLPTDDSAHVKVYVLAFHGIVTDANLQSVTARVTWNLDLERFEGQWFIRKVVVKKAAPFDRPELMDQAHRRAEEGFVRNAKP